MTELADRRQQKTRAALQTAFRELLLDQGYDAVTIGALTTFANVGRSTFYEHYRTKDDLLRASLSRPFNALADLTNTPACSDVLRDWLRHFRDNQQVGRVLLGWPTRPVLVSALADLIAHRLCAIAHVRPLIPVEVIARQIAEMQLTLLESWISGRPAFGLEAAVEALITATGALVDGLCRVARAQHPS